jgi:hypothetical protein
MATKPMLTSILIPKPLHKRLKSVVAAKGGQIQLFAALELERAVTREEAKRKKGIA